MTTHGHWDGDEPHRPIVYATFHHPRVPMDRTLDFLIDTGSDQTFIVPDHQRLLQIPKDFLEFQTGPVHTLGGIFTFNFLTGCSLVFTDQDGGTHEIKDLPVYFSRQRDGFLRGFFRRRKEYLTGEGQFPSILGRDVLKKLALGFCRPEDLLFVSRKHCEYAEALKTHFSKCQDKPEWFGTHFDISEYGIERH